MFKAALFARYPLLGAAFKTSAGGVDEEGEAFVGEHERRYYFMHASLLLWNASYHTHPDAAAKTSNEQPW